MIYNDGKAGFLKVIFGPMFSEKSGELLSECIKAQKYQNKKVVMLKPSIDDRFEKDKIVSRVGLDMKAYSIELDISKNIDRLIELYDMKNQDIIGIDEAQFFDKGIIELVQKLLDLGKYVIVAGLNLDSYQNPFGQMDKLMLSADELVQKYAFCAICGRPAIFTHRTIKETNNKNDVIRIGDVEIYEPRCRICFNEKLTKD